MALRNEEQMAEVDMLQREESDVVLVLEDDSRWHTARDDLAEDAGRWAGHGVRCLTFKVTGALRR